MKKWWLSWHHEPRFSAYTIWSPWWVSGFRTSDDARTIVAAVEASDERSAKAQIASSYDDPPESIEWRFVKEQPDDWEPFCGRFPRAKWMRWRPADDAHLKDGGA